MAPKYPAIPEPTIDPASLRDAVLALKQAFEILSGQRGAGQDAAVTPGDFNSAVDDINSDLSTKVSKSGDTMTGFLVLHANPDANLKAATKQYVDAGDATTLVAIPKKNYIINGAMMVSQENGATAGTTSGYYPVDGFYVTNSAGGTMSTAQVASATPAGSPNRLRVTVTAADASVAAGDLFNIGHAIEGLRIADLRSGSASAKTITIRFGCKAPAGTYSVSLRSGLATRSYLAEYTISAGEANTDVVKSVTIALDQTGTWAVDNTVGVYVYWALMAGSTFQTAAGSWTAGNFVGSSNQFNFFGTNGNVFELFDVGLYEGSSAPAFVVPDYKDELDLCMRYYRRTTGEAGSEPTLYAYAGAGQSCGYTVQFPVPMRAIPTVSFTGTWTVINTANTQPVLAGASASSASLYVTATALGQCTFQPNNSGRVAYNARL